MTRNALVTGASGQDGYLLTQRLLADGVRVHATVLSEAGVDQLRVLDPGGDLVVHRIDLCQPMALTRLVAEIRPDEMYNLAGQSSVSASFTDPSNTWRTNADAVHAILETLRLNSPETRFYQASSSEMFGSLPGRSIVHNEDSPLEPQSPYAAAKAAAHLLCDAYRRAYDLRIACGIVFNHESRRRSTGFLTRKVVDHVRQLRGIARSDLHVAAPLVVGNLAAQRDWGFAPDYVDGMTRIVRQVAVRSSVLGRPMEDDVAANYRDYVLGTGELHPVWELIDRAFALAGLPLEWDRNSTDPTRWGARFAGSSAKAVVVDPDLIRPADPAAISADAARARQELGWRPRTGVDAFLTDMLEA
jgi:GDPmannose 4,6-dehydratase